MQYHRNLYNAALSRLASGISKHGSPTPYLETLLLEALEGQFGFQDTHTDFGIPTTQAVLRMGTVPNPKRTVTVQMENMHLKSSNEDPANLGEKSLEGTSNSPLSASGGHKNPGAQEHANIKMGQCANNAEESHKDGNANSRPLSALSAKREDNVPASSRDTSHIPESKDSGFTAEGPKPAEIPQLTHIREKPETVDTLSQPDRPQPTSVKEKSHLYPTPT
ncbi:hypothetical protein NFI96_007985 [Prochilodus magdalenae]|nr:hypothetical protein NFI96_007985 [Prochilodus magdalenae]